MRADIFKKVILIGRPASGKSEFIHFLKATPLEKRREDYHIGELFELDDFLWLWQKFLEDDLWEAAGEKRPFSKRGDHAYVMTEGALLDFCLEKFNHEIRKAPQGATTFVEFARGKGDGGYQHALNRLSDEVLDQAVILYIDASYEEALKRNEARYQEKLKHSVLAHKVPDEDMERFALATDWQELTHGQSSGTIEIRGKKIPFATALNEPECKTPDQFHSLYSKTLDRLHEVTHRIF